MLRSALFGVGISVLCFWLPLAACVVYAQAPVARPVAPPVVAAPMKAEPTLTEVQRLQVQNVLLQLELAQARAQALVVSLQVPGYDLDLQTLVYRPKPTEAKK
jgi:hypothetical protein